MSGESRTRMNTFHLCSLRYSDPRSSPSPPRYKSPSPRCVARHLEFASLSPPLPSCCSERFFAGKPLQQVRKGESFWLPGVFFLAFCSDFSRGIFGGPCGCFPGADCVCFPWAKRWTRASSQRGCACSPSTTTASPS